MARFEGKKILVTGAASGIGRAAALRFAEEGATLACVDVQAEAAEGAAKEARELGANATAFTCDVSDPEAVDAMVNAALGALGGLDSLCNIAGILHFDNTHELALERWNQILAVNLTGTFLVTKACLPALLADGGGSIVNMSSIAGLAGQPWSAAYGASKAGVLGFTRSLAVEYGRQGLRANAVCPGSVQTPITKAFRFPDGVDQSLLQRILPLDDFRGPEKAASVITFLASDDAAHINGESVRCDGGTLA